MRTQMIDKDIPGIEGRFSINSWLKNDFRISIYNAAGNSLYYPTDNSGAKEFIAALSSPHGSGTHIFRQHRGVAEITRVGDEYFIVCYDSLNASMQVKARFSVDQARQIIDELSRSNS